MRSLALVGLMLGVVAFVCCTNNAIGRRCINPSQNAITGTDTQISHPALECPSRLCLLHSRTNSDPDAGVAGQGLATCTAFCGNNSDCPAETTEQCEAGFACAIVAQAGPFCCQKMCVCRRDLKETENVDHDGGIITPFSCDTSKKPDGTAVNPNITCQNIK